MLADDIAADVDLLKERNTQNDRLISFGVGLPGPTIALTFCPRGHRKDSCPWPVGQITAARYNPSYLTFCRRGAMARRPHPHRFGAAWRPVGTGGKGLTCQESCPRTA